MEITRREFLGYTAGALIALDSVRRRLSGRVCWKGRTYP